MKAYKTTPKNESFFSDYASLVPTLFMIGWIAQLVSYITEIGGINAVIFSTLKDFNPALATSISLAGALIGAALLEIGLRKFVPYSVKAVIHGRFSGEHMLMSVFIITCAVLLIGASGYLSFNNSKNMVEAYMPEPETKNYDYAQNLYSQNRDQAYHDFKMDSSEISDRYKAQIVAIKSSYKSKVDAKWQEVRKWSARETPSIKYTTKKNNIKVDIKNLEAERDQRIADLQAKKADELQAVFLRRSNKIKSADHELSISRDSIQAFNSNAAIATEKKINNYGGGLAYFTIFCLIVFILSVIIDEVHKKGSGIETRIEPGAFDFAPGLLSEFWTGLSENLEYNTRKKISGWFSPKDTREEIVPGYGRVIFDYSGLKQKKIIVVDNSRQVLTSGGKITQTHYRKSPSDKVLTNGLSEADNEVLTTADNGAADNDQPLSDKSRQQIGGELSAIEIEATDKGDKVRLSGPIFSTVRKREFDLSDVEDFEKFKASARQSYHRQFVSGEPDTRLTHKARWHEMKKVLDYYGIEYWPKGEKKITYDYKQSDEYLKNNT